MIYFYSLHTNLWFTFYFYYYTVLPSIIINLLHCYSLKKSTHTTAHNYNSRPAKSCLQIFFPFFFIFRVIKNTSVSRVNYNQVQIPNLRLFLHISSCIYWNFDDIFLMYSCYYIIYKLYHKLFGYFVFYKIIIYNNCQFGTSDKYFHLKSCF